MTVGLVSSGSEREQTVNSGGQYNVRLNENEPNPSDVLFTIAEKVQ
jgi:hypothetical protein